MFEKTKEDLTKAITHCESLVNSKVYDPKAIGDDEVPKDIGVYIWRTKKDNTIVYVGRAIGERGLFQRIVKQHLYRSYKMSVFKKQVADEFSLDIKEQAVSYIKDNFTFSFIQFGRKDKYIVNLVETLMINEYRPKYNRAGKYDETCNTKL